MNPQLLNHQNHTYLLPGRPIQCLATLARRKFAPPLYSPLLGLSFPKQPSEDNYLLSLSAQDLHNLSAMPGPMRPEFFLNLIKERYSIVLGEICVRVFFQLEVEVTLVLTTQYF
jgi:hypothetical protein